MCGQRLRHAEDLCELALQIPRNVGEVSSEVHVPDLLFHHCKLRISSLFLLLSHILDFFMDFIYPLHELFLHLLQLALTFQRTRHGFTKLIITSLALVVVCLNLLQGFQDSLECRILDHPLRIQTAGYVLAEEIHGLPKFLLSPPHVVHSLVETLLASIPKPCFRRSLPWSWGDYISPQRHRCVKGVRTEGLMNVFVHPGIVQTLLFEFREDLLHGCPGGS
mmetsp:Transcript_10573/g.18263  ORF Transcript_10573/g.18263 Transcript_10573/m.18263 type:complete len:221 (+) Transcript_10573:826-1488(+)